MFQKILNLLNTDDRHRSAGNGGAPWWRSLAPGVLLQFGPISQPELANGEFHVIAVRSYDFGNVQLPAYDLGEGEKTLCSLIVAEGSGKPYLALSKKLTSRDLENLFDEEDRRRLADPAGVQILYAREHAPRLAEWVTMRYRRRISGVRGKQTAQGITREFEYALYVGDNDDRAIEVERYDDGLDIYVTIYRPVEDVRRMRRPSLAAVPTRLATPATVLPLTREPTTLPQDPPRLALSAVPAASALPDPGEGYVECGLVAAARIIDETLRSGMSLSDLLRKVLGLPVSMRDSVRFELALTEEDYRLLARRYEKDAADHADIRRHIAEELAHFAGEGRRRPPVM